MMHQAGAAQLLQGKRTFRSLLRHNPLIVVLPQHQSRCIFDFAAVYPDETVLVFSAAVMIAGYRIWKLELQTREQVQSLKSLRDGMKLREQMYEKSTRELQNSNKSLQEKYNAMQDLKQRMEASIVDRGKAGEEVLGALLAECKIQSIIKDFQLQHEISPGKRPDGIIEIMDGTFIVVDCKAPFPPYELSEQTRREYTDKLKLHIRQLSDKRYNSALDQQRLMVTVMMLPGEGYLQAAYDEGRDVFELYKFSRERNVLVLGPNGLRSLLQMVKIILEEQAAKDRLRDAHVHEKIAMTLQPLWLDSLLPSMKRISTLLENIVTTWNIYVDNIVAFDRALRSKEILDLAKARKTELPKSVTLPKTIIDK